MNCWKSINFHKEFGLTRIYSMSFLLGLVAFIFLYVPLSIVHGSMEMNKAGVIPFVAVVIFLPVIHSFMHILPLITIYKRVKIKDKTKKASFPRLTYYPTSYLSKQRSMLVALTPTLLITIPGIIASYSFSDYDVYILSVTALHIGISFTDFLYIANMAKAPKKSWIESDHSGFAILVKDR